MTNPGRLKDLADVLELIKMLDLPIDFVNQLDPFVRGKFQELTRDAMVAEEEGLMEESEDLGIDEEEMPTDEQPDTPPILEADPSSREGQNDP